MKKAHLIHQPYPFEDGERSVIELIGRSLAVGVFIGLFLLIFQPFDLSKWQISGKTAYILGFGVVTFGCLLVMRLGVYQIFPRFFNENGWTIGREIFLNLSFLILVALANFLYAGQLGIIRFTPVYFLWSFGSVLAVGVFPITFGVLTKYHKALKEYSRISDLTLLPVTEEFIEFTAENERDKLRVSLNELLYIESADNYSRFVFVSNPPELLRASLSRLENQLTTEQLVRCHRSYLVNLTKVKKVMGNAQGYRLGLEDSAFEVPVARRFSHLVDRLKTGLS